PCWRIVFFAFRRFIRFHTARVIRVTARAAGSRRMSAMPPIATEICAPQRNPAVPLAVRMRAAVEALPFEHPKLSAVAHLGGEAFAERLEQAVARSNAARIIDHCPTARE